MTDSRDCQLSPTHQSACTENSAAMQNSLTPSLDLSGKLIIKVQLGDDIRRIPIHNEDITYDELVLMMQRVYRGKLSTNDDIVIKYKDEDNDLITIFDSSDLTFAIQCSRILKLTLFVSGHHSSNLGDVGSLRKELQAIRDSVNVLLDRVDPGPSIAVSAESTVPAGLVSNVKSTAPSGGVNLAQPGGGKEFDPLSTQRSVSHDDTGHNKVPSAFAPIHEVQGAVTSTERAGAATPDSLSSIGSSASNQQRQQQPQQPVSSGTAANYSQAVNQQGYPVPGTVSYNQPTAPTGQPSQPPVQPTPTQYSQSPAGPPPRTTVQPPPAQFAPSSTPTGQPPHPPPSQFAQSSTPAQPAPSQYSQSAQPPSSQYAQPGQAPVPSSSAQSAMPPGQGAQPSGQYGQSSVPAGPATQQPSQQYPGYGQTPQAYGQYPPGQPQAAPQAPQGMYSQPGAAPQTAGLPQPQPLPQQQQQQQQQQSMYSAGAWNNPNMQAPGQQRMPGFPSPGGAGQQSSGSPVPPGVNPYSRGPGYGAGYPRPASNYQ